MSETKFRDVKVVLRKAGRITKTWMVEVDTACPIAELLPDLVDALPVEGTPADYDLRHEGSLSEPVLVLDVKTATVCMALTPDMLRTMARAGQR